MKKQILILAIFTLAIIAGTSEAFGQLIPSEFTTGPIPLTLCVGDAQHPKAGISYEYILDNTTSDVVEYSFWATKDQDFIRGVPTATNEDDSLQITTGDLLAVSPIYWTPGATNQVDITWSADILSNTVYQSDVAGEPTFVVGWAKGSCTDNLKVWEIDPTPSFTVDILVIDDDTDAPIGYGDATSTQCVDEVRAAVYDVANDAVLYNYGWDTLYYEVVSANFVTSWLPTFFLTGLDATQGATIGWASSYANAQAGTFIQSGDITSGTFVGTTALTAAAGVLDNSVGLSLYVQVVIANNNYETLGDETIGLSVAGLDAEGYDIDDDATCTIPANAADAADDDETTRTITSRPTVTEGTTIILGNSGVITP